MIYRNGNIELKDDKKGNNFWIYKIDSEGYHHALNLTPKELTYLKEIINYMEKHLEDSK